jgi:DNA-binding MarR family transcriptional regulator
VEERLPLATLLSQALVAYTIEFDNEFERQSPHRTARFGSSGGGGPWLVSMVMWFNCMCHVGEAPITVAELWRRARTRTNLAGMHRWRYIDVDASPDDIRTKPPESDLLVRATHTGRLAQQVLRPLARDIETRWEERWGTDQVEALRVLLRAVVSRCELDLPDCLPILQHGLWTAGPARPAFSPRAEGSDDADALALSSLLSRALLMIAINFEARSKVSLAIHADLLRVLGNEPIPVRDLPRLAGVSKEAISMALGFVVKRGLADLEPNPNGKPGNEARLTTQGLIEQELHGRLLRNVEEQWDTQFGAAVTGALRGSLESLGGSARGSGWWQGMPPFPAGWRAKVPRPETLPHFPMVLHRGGYPDGS